jgi:hypothetical protein
MESIVEMNGLTVVQKNGVTYVNGVELDSNLTQTRKSKLIDRFSWFSLGAWFAVVLQAIIEAVIL